MPVDPAVAALLGQIESKVVGLVGVAADLDARAQALDDNVAALGDLLDEGTPPPPPPATTPVTIISVNTSRPDAATVKVDYTLAGTRDRATRVAVSVTPGGWQEFGAPSWPAGTLAATVNVKPGAGTLHFHVWDTGPGPGQTGGWVIKSNVPYVAAAGQPPPPPPPVGTGTFKFRADPAGVVSIYESDFADGQLFIPLGVNVPGPNGYWGGGFTPVGKAARLRDTWGWNFIRLFEQRTTGGDAEYTPSAHNPWTIKQVVDEYTAAGFVVMLDWHQYGFGAALNQAKTDEMTRIHTGWAEQFKNNPRVWLELCNEPESSYAAGGFNQQACYDRWYNHQAPVVRAIRATGATNMIVVNDCQSGMGCDDFWQMGPSTGSAIMARGAELLAQDPLGNLMWDTHFYDAFGWAGPDAMGNNCVGRYTDAQRNARLLDYIDRVHKATGRPTLGGEFGWQNGESSTTGVGFHAPYRPSCGSRTRLAQEAFTRVALSRNTGGTQWPGFQLCTNGNDAYDSSTLTQCGQDWIAYCRAARAKMNTASDSAASSFPAGSYHTEAPRPEPDGPALMLAMPNRNTAVG